MGCEFVTRSRIDHALKKRKSNNVPDGVSLSGGTLISSLTENTDSNNNANATTDDSENETNDFVDDVNDAPDKEHLPQIGCPTGSTKAHNCEPKRKKTSQRSSSKKAQTGTG